ncbi:hypothetical protein [Vulcanococcus sp. Clear-D1]|uniref:hypothetical protein n=1 Tax=Vulcanococcus sp. Clear-D1 TaxID=2766970 RepID=UPI0019865E75|nr:hypothetical protein [Vulcanococcus sp. Clear-D1]MBD1193101.1 hypothetical protein [Vulcanococcus sp. Clear-D1]
MAAAAPWIRSVVLNAITRHSARRWVGLELPKAPCNSTFLYLFERVELEQHFGLLTGLIQSQVMA